MQSTPNHDRTTLLGREDDRRRVAALLAGSRLVTLTGPGGIGKTSLGRAALDDVDAGGRWFVDCSLVDREADLARAVAGAFSLVVTEAEDADAAVVAYLSPRRGVLFLDNLEQLPEVAGRLERWLDEAPEVRILATSRIPIPVAGGAEHHVRGLTQPRDDSPGAVEASAAGQLFLRSARRLGVLEVLEPPVAADLAALLRRLDGMPLAIELAAGRSRVLTPGGLLRHLDDPTVVAAGPGDGHASRHASLDRVLAMTIDLLPAEERRLLAVLSVCPGTFDLDLAAQLAHGIAVVPAMDVLVSSGIVSRVGETSGEMRFRLLDTIRVRASRELGPGELADLRERHARAMTSITESLAGEWTRDERRALARFIAEDDNIAAAVSWAVDHDQGLGLRLLAAYDRVAQGGVHLERSVQWCRAMLRHPDGDASLRLELTSSLLRLLTRFAGPDEALSLEAELLAGIVGASQAMKRAAYLRLGHAYYARGELLETARTSMLASASSDDPDDAAALASDAEAIRAWVIDGDGGRSAALYARSAAANARAGRVSNQAISMFKCALVQLRTGRPDEATAAARAAVDLSPPGNLRAYAGSVLVLALVEVGEVAAARVALGEAWHQVDHEARIDRIEVLEAAVVLLAGERRHAGALTALAVADRDRPPTGWVRDPHVAFVIDGWRRRATEALGALGVRLAGAEAASATIESCVAAALSVRTPGYESPAGMVERLTPREVEVLELVAQGRSDGEIAAELFISPKTASVHVANIKGKLGLDSRLQVALHAREMGIARSGHGSTIN